MGRYLKKMVETKRMEVEAIQFLQTHQSSVELHDFFINADAQNLLDIKAVLLDGSIIPFYSGIRNNAAFDFNQVIYLDIPSKCNTIRAYIGDWIIKDYDKFIICDPFAFKEIYQKVYQKIEITYKWQDVNFHTGFYRFIKKDKGFHFKIEGIPCLIEQGYENLIFFTGTNLIGECFDNKDVIPVRRVISKTSVKK